MEKLDLSLVIKHDLTRDVWFTEITNKMGILQFKDDSHSRAMIMSKVINFINNSIK
jgi:hypothetical protein